MQPSDQPSLWDVSQFILAQTRQRLARLPAEHPELPTIALEILLAAPQVEFSFADLCDPRLWTSKFQNHAQSTFADISLTLWRHEHLFLDAYVWVDRNTSIHDHNFAGAFKVARGKYTQLLYHYVSQTAFVDGIERGELQLLQKEDLRCGEGQAILPHDGHIHQVFHADLPCVTLCLRTTALSPALHSYLPSGWKIALKRPNEERRPQLERAMTLWKQGERSALAATLATLGLARVLGHTFTASPTLHGDARWWDFLVETFPAQACDVRTLADDHLREQQRGERMLRFLRSGN